MRIDVRYSGSVEYIYDNLNQNPKYKIEKENKHKSKKKKRIKWPLVPVGKTNRD
jgi:hypothetical protein